MRQWSHSLAMPSVVTQLVHKACAQPVLGLCLHSAFERNCLQVVLVKYFNSSAELVHNFAVLQWQLEAQAALSQLNWHDACCCRHCCRRRRRCCCCHRHCCCCCCCCRSHL